MAPPIGLLRSFEYLTEVSPTGEARIVKTVSDTTTVRDLLAKRQFLPIVDDPKCFWELFAHHAAHARSKFCNFAWEVTVLPDSSIQIKTREHIFESVANGVEKSRNLFLRCIKEGAESSSSLVVLTTEAFLFPPSAEVRIPTLEDRMAQAKYRTRFTEYWEPLIPEMAEAVGLLCTVVDQALTRIPCGDSKITPDLWKKIVLSPKKEFHLTFPIPPLAIKTEKTLSASTQYQYFLAGKFADFTLASSLDEGICKLHKLIFYHNAGEIAQKMLDDTWLESDSNTLQLPYSSATIRQFVEYVYLGAEATFEKMAFSLAQAHLGTTVAAPAAAGGAGREDVVMSSGGAGREDVVTSSKEFDLCELLEMAHFFSLQPLVDICTNLISAVAETSDCEAVAAMAERLENEHLKKLAAYLTSA